MASINSNYLKLKAGYLFPEIARRVRAFAENHPDAASNIIRCGIGDVTEPLPTAAINALKKATDELGDRATFRNCRLLGNQGVLFLATGGSRQYFKDCYIEGTTDFIFGASTAVFDHCTIQSKKNSFITAASTPAQQAYGFLFLNCKLTADTALAKKVYLGRPWRPNAKVVYLRCELGGHITPAGWENWKNPENEKTAYYAEYRSTGPGARPAGRVPWAHQLTAKEAKHYTLKQIFGGREGWEPGR